MKEFHIEPSGLDENVVHLDENVVHLDEKIFTQCNLTWQKALDTSLEIISVRTITCERQWEVKQAESRLYKQHHLCKRKILKLNAGSTAAFKHFQELNSRHNNHPCIHWLDLGIIDWIQDIIIITHASTDRLHVGIID